MVVSLPNHDATIGRFISPDTVTQDPSNPQTLNRYSYCVNNPLKYTDPTGHDQIITTGGVNGNGETWYTICDGQGNLLAIATGIDDLAQKMNDCSATSRDVDLPLGDSAAYFFHDINESSGVPTPSKHGDLIKSNNAVDHFTVADFGSGYVDINISIGYVVGVTGGFMFNGKGAYPYIGGGFIYIPGASITYSPYDPTTGWNLGLQSGAGVGGQAGYSNDGLYWEAGAVSPGVSLTGFYVWQWRWPWTK
jgi:hypothetical protein